MRTGGEQDFQAGGNWEKLRKNLQHCIIFCTRTALSYTEAPSLGKGQDNRGWEKGKIKNLGGMGQRLPSAASTCFLFISPHSPSGK